MLGRELGMEAAELDGLRLGSLIHDIGKIAVPAEILAKPGRLSCRSSTSGGRSRRWSYSTTSDWTAPAIPAVSAPATCCRRRSSSRWRMSSRRCRRTGRTALGTEAALAEIRDGAGTRYDADVAAACDRVMTEQGFTFTP